MSSTNSYIPLEEGTYSFSVKINDVGGAFITTANSVNNVVTDATPVATAFAVANTEGTPSTPTVVAHFTDPGSHSLLSDYNAQINWGNGQSSGGTISFTNGSNDSAGYNVSSTNSYIPLEDGTYSFSVKINDVGGAFITTADSVNNVVADAPLSNPTLILTSAVEGAPLGTAASPIVVATFTDANPGDHSSDFSGTTIDWGDGTGRNQDITPGTVAWVSTVGTTSTYCVSGYHTYLEEGSHPISVSVVDVGTETTLASGTINIADAALHGATVAINAVAGVSFTNDLASFTDDDPAGTVSPINDYAATIDWGDGTLITSGLVVSNGSGGFNVEGTHTYANGGPETPIITITDNGNLSTQIVVNSSAAVDVAPVINDTPNWIAAQNTPSNNPLTFTDANLLSHASDADSFPQALSVISITQPTHGHINSVGGTYTYTPDITYVSGPDSFTYTVTDGFAPAGGYTPTGGTLVTATGTVNVYVEATPLDLNKLYLAPELDANNNGTINIDASHGVLVNDSNPDSTFSGALTVYNPDPLDPTHKTNPLIETSVQGGTVSVNADGSFTYTAPASGLFTTGTDSFTYQVWDGINTFNNQPVNPVLSAPITAYVEVIKADYSVLENTSLTNSNTVSSLPAADTLSVTLVTPPSNANVGPDGHFTLNSDGTFTYSPNHNYSSEGGAPQPDNNNGGPPISPLDAFSIHATSLNGLVSSNDLTVSVDVTQNHITDILIDVKGDNVPSDSQPVLADHAPKDLNLGDSSTYTYIGNLSTPVFDIINNPSTTPLIDSNTSYSFFLAGVTLGNRNGNPSVQNDFVIINGDQLFTTKSLSYLDEIRTGGVYDLNVTARDSNFQFFSKTLHIQITPEAPGDITIDHQSVLVTVTKDAVVGNLGAVDNPLDGANFTWISDTLSGAFAVSNNELVVSHPEMLVGGTVVNVTLQDTNLNVVTNPNPNIPPAGLSVQKTFTINILDVTPSGADQNFSTLSTPANPGTVTANVLADSINYRNDGNPLTAVLLRDVSHGKLVLNSDGVFVYTPAPNFRGVDSFEFGISDGLLLTDPIITFHDDAASINPIMSADIVRLSIDFSAFNPLFNFESSVVTVSTGGTRDITDHLSIAQSNHVSTIGEHIFYNGQLVGKFAEGHNQIQLGFNNFANADIVSAVSEHLKISFAELTSIHNIKVNLTDRFGNNIEQEKAISLHTKNDIAAVQDAINVVKKNAQEVKEIHNNFIINWDVLPANKPAQAPSKAALRGDDYTPDNVPTTSTDKSVPKVSFSQIPGIWNLMNKNSAMK